MGDYGSAPGADKEIHWELSSSAPSPRSDSSSSTPTSLFSSPSTPESPADTEISFPSLGPQEAKNPETPIRDNVIGLPSLPNHVVFGQTLYAPSRILGMRNELVQARKRGEFPPTTSNNECPQTIVEDYQHLHRLRASRGDLTLPPPERYNLLKIDIARRIKARDEAQGGSANLQEMDNRVQSWMNSINKENRMLEITQAALQRKGISNPTQDDLDAIAEEFMQIAERTLLDVANPLRMNATRMEGNISRFDSQLDGFDGAMTAQLNTVNSVLTNLNTTMSNSMSTQLQTLDTMLMAQSTTFNGSVNILNTALNTVTTDLHQLTTNLPAIIAAAAQAAIREQLSTPSYQQVVSQQHHTFTEAPPSYTTNMSTMYYQPTTNVDFPADFHTANRETPVQEQHGREITQQQGALASKSSLRRLLRRITGKWRSTNGKSSKVGTMA